VLNAANIRVDEIEFRPFCRHPTPSTKSAPTDSTEPSSIIVRTAACG
jgi:hypothetical protein